MSEEKFVPSGLLIDATGVLYDSVSGQDGSPIVGSIEAIIKLKSLGIPFQIISNASTKIPADLVNKFQRLGFPLNQSEVISSIPMAKEFIIKNNLRPACFVGKDIEKVFEDVDTRVDPNCVLLTFIDSQFKYTKINEICKLLWKMDDPLLITVGNGKFFKREKGNQLDIGSFAAGIQYSTGCKKIVIGKPNKEYYDIGLLALNLHASEVLMIGDDPIGDIAGAQNCGIKAVQVMTGKYRTPTLGDPVPYKTVKNLKEAVDLFFP